MAAIEATLKLLLNIRSCFSPINDVEHDRTLKGNPSPLLRVRRNLPEEILFEEILPRLPVKSLLRFKCVSKSWRSVIESDWFVENHRRNMTRNPSLAHHRVLLMHNNDYLYDCSLNWLLTPKKPSYSAVFPNDQTVYAGKLIGCCDGVACFLGKYFDSIFMWNPATRVITELPMEVNSLCWEFGQMEKKTGFGWDESSGAYKVFAVFCVDDPGLGRVYSSKTKSWKTISTCLSSPYQTGKYACGNLHWFYYTECKIEHFDLEKDEFGIIELPVSTDEAWPGEIGGRLAILYEWEEKVEVWVMKEYGVKDSWFKLVTFAPFTCPELKNRIYVHGPFYGEGRDGEVYVIYRKFLVVYSTRDGAIVRVKNRVDCSGACVFVESLVSPWIISGRFDKVRDWKISA